MNFKILTLTALFAGIHSVSAFSIDFTGLNQDLDTTFTGADGETLVITVPNFGNVSFGVDAKDVTAGFDQFDRDGEDATAILFNSDTPIIIEFFAGSDVTNVMVDFVGLNVGEEPMYTAIDGQSGVITTNKGTVGIAGISFDRVGPKVPEPSTALLGALGALTLLRRRR